MQYAHSQSAPLYLLVAATGIAMLIGGWLTPEFIVQIILLCSGALMFVLALSFHHLTVSDQGDELLISFGPLPLFRKRLQYSKIERVEQARSTILDGWGVHLSPSGGWTWNLWGFDCVDVWYKRGSKTKKVRIGTDDPGGLAAFLKKCVSQDDK